MRFRKSVQICKGVKLNLSKSGASLTLGPGKGVSMNVGTKGAYFNWSIPGTGVYDRVRVDTLLKDKLGGLFGAKAEEEPQEEKKSSKSTAKSTGKSTAKSSGKSTLKTSAKGASGKAAKAAAGVSEEELERLESEAALIAIHQLAPDVTAKASGVMDAGTAEQAIEEWLSEAEAPIAICVQTEAVPEKKLVMVDLDLPEIEDMPQDKLTQLADGTLKIKKKSQKESREDYKTCVFGLGEYVAGNVFGLVPAAERIAVSAYTQRRSEKTGDAEDVFIYSVVFERNAFKKGYQKKEPAEFCDGMKSRYYVLASGVMKQIAPFEAEEL